MTRIEFDVQRNEFGSLAAMLPEIRTRAIRKQVLVSTGDVKQFIVQYGAVDTGNMLGSTTGEMVSANEGIVSVSAESGDGFPYPRLVNSGGVHVSPRPFFDDAVALAKQEFGTLMRREIEAALP